MLNCWNSSLFLAETLGNQSGTRFFDTSSCPLLFRFRVSPLQPHILSHLKWNHQLIGWIAMSKHFVELFP